MLKKTGSGLSHYWITSSASPFCIGCSNKFGSYVRRHCCRPCRGVFCSACLTGRLPNDHPRFPKGKVCAPCLDQYEDDKAVDKIRSLLGADGSTSGRSYLQNALTTLRDTAIDLQGDGGRGYSSRFNTLAPVGLKQPKRASGRNKAKNRYLQFRP